MCLHFEMQGGKGGKFSPYHPIKVHLAVLIIAAAIAYVY